MFYTVATMLLRIMTGLELLLIRWSAPTSTYDLRLTAYLFVSIANLSNTFRTNWTNRSKLCKYYLHPRSQRCQILFRFVHLCNPISHFDSYGRYWRSEFKHQFEQIEKSRRGRDFHYPWAWDVGARDSVISL